MATLGPFADDHSPEQTDDVEHRQASPDESTHHDLPPKRAKSAGELQVTCGKVGGIDRYSPHFGPFAEKLYSPLLESRDRSEYAVAGVGRVAFVKDADESSMLVGLAEVKPDRMIRRYVAAALGRAGESAVGVEEARALVMATALELGVSPRALDGAIWSYRAAAARRPRGPG